LGSTAASESHLPWHCAPPIVPGHRGDEATAHAFMIDQMVDRIKEINPPSGADALRELRRAFPDSPLTLRVNALEALMRRWDLPKAS
jgi:hypothetical protein